MRPRIGEWMKDLLAEADVTVGTTPNFDICISDESIIGRLVGGGSLAIGEGYMDGEWSSSNLLEVLTKIFSSKLERKLRGNWWKHLPRFAMSRISNPQSIWKSREVGKEHYDLPALLFDRMLGGPANDYSCLRWGAEGETLEQAQIRKWHHTAMKLHLRPGMRVLDIGCGRGGFAKFLATNYGVTVVGLTISKEQAARARENCRGLPVTIHLADYREVDLSKLGLFDAVVSVGMLEHVGEKNLDTYMRFAANALVPGGIFVLHSIVGGGKSNPWINKYIFPGGVSPLQWKVLRAARPHFGEPKDWENFGWDYYRTLMAWHANCLRHREAIDRECGDYFARTFGSTERFWRMWEFYLLASAARFKSGMLSVGQWVFVKGPTEGVYITSRPPLAMAA